MERKTVEPIEKQYSGKRRVRHELTGCEQQGIYKLCSGRYRVGLEFNKIYYSMGTFWTYAEAVKVQRLAERKMRSLIIEYFRIWKEKVDADPHWALEHPLAFNLDNSW